MSYFPPQTGRWSCVAPGTQAGSSCPTPPTASSNSVKMNLSWSTAADHGYMVPAAASSRMDFELPQGDFAVELGQRLAVARLAQPLGLLGILQEPGHAGRQLLDISRLEEHAGLAVVDDLAQAANGRGDHRSSRGHRLDREHSEGLDARGEKSGQRCFVNFADIRGSAPQADFVFEILLANDLPEPFLVVAVAIQIEEALLAGGLQGADEPGSPRRALCASPGWKGRRSADHGYMRRSRRWPAQRRGLPSNSG